MGRVTSPHLWPDVNTAVRSILAMVSHDGPTSPGLQRLASLLREVLADLGPSPSPGAWVGHPRWAEVRRAARASLDGPGGKVDNGAPPSDRASPRMRRHRRRQRWTSPRVVIVAGYLLAVAGIIAAQWTSRLVVEAFAGWWALQVGGSVVLYAMLVAAHTPAPPRWLDGTLARPVVTWLVRTMGSAVVLGVTLGVGALLSTYLPVSRQAGWSDDRILVDVVIATARVALACLVVIATFWLAAALHRAGADRRAAGVDALVTRGSLSSRLQRRSWLDEASHPWTTFYGGLVLLQGVLIVLR